VDFATHIGFDPISFNEQCNPDDHCHGHGDTADVFNADGCECQCYPGWADEVPCADIAWLDASDNDCTVYTDADTCAAASLVSHNGHTARTACCACGGGDRATEEASQYRLFPEVIRRRITGFWTTLAEDIVGYISCDGRALFMSPFGYVGDPNGYEIHFDGVETACPDYIRTVPFKADFYTAAPALARRLEHAVDEDDEHREPYNIHWCFRIEASGEITMQLVDNQAYDDLDFEVILTSTPESRVTCEARHPKWFVGTWRAAANYPDVGTWQFNCDFTFNETFSDGGGIQFEGVEHVCTGHKADFFISVASFFEEEEEEEMEEEADEMEEQEEENDAPSEYALLEGWWSNWHGAMAQNHSKHTVKICPQGTFIKTMQMVTSSKLNQSLLRIQNTRCSPVAMQESRIGHNPHFGHHPGHFHRRRFYHRRRPHFHRRRFHHSRRRFHHHSRRRFHHHSRRRFHHSRRRFHRSHRNVNAGNFREATIFSNASVDGLCFGGKCAGYSGPAHRVTCGHQSRLAGYALRVDCKIRSIRFFCRHLGQ